MAKPEQTKPTCWRWQLSFYSAIMDTMYNNTVLSFLTWLNMVCWGVCFWWMHRISSRQDVFLAELKEQGRRVEALSRAEHDLIKEVHPQVGEIKEGMQEMVDAVRENAAANQTHDNAALSRNPAQPGKPTK
jgi:hypothetical protein